MLHESVLMTAIEKLKILHKSVYETNFCRNYFLSLKERWELGTCYCTTDSITFECFRFDSLFNLSNYLPNTHFWYRELHKTLIGILFCDSIGAFTFYFPSARCKMWISNQWKCKGTQCSSSFILYNYSQKCVCTSNMMSLSSSLNTSDAIVSVLYYKLCIPSLKDLQYEAGSKRRG